jgi:hypothetical protein
MHTRLRIGALLLSLLAPVGPAVANPLPVKTNANLQYFGYWFSDGRYGNHQSEVFPYTNMYVAILDAWDSNLDWVPLLTTSMCSAMAQSKRIYLVAKNTDIEDPPAPGQPPKSGFVARPLTWANVLQAASTPCPASGLRPWNAVDLVEVFHETEFNATQVETKIGTAINPAPGTFRALLASYGLPEKPMGIMQSAECADNLPHPSCKNGGADAKNAPSLSWVGVEAYIFQTVANLNAYLDRAKNNAGNKSVVFVPMAFDRAGAWSDARDLAAMQRSSYDKAYNDSRVIGILPFAYGRQALDKSQGATRLHPELKVPHYQMAERILGISPTFTVNHRRYLAEGVQNGFFKTSIALTNANTGTANVRVNLRSSSGVIGSQYVQLIPSSRLTVYPELIDAFDNADFSIEVESDLVVGVDRLVRWDGTGYGSNLESAAPALSTTWHFAEGTLGQHLYYLFQNPNGAAASVSVTFLRSAGAPVTKVYPVAANTRFTLYVNGVTELAGTTDLGASISSTLPIIAERASYLNSFTAGTSGLGATSPAANWYFAEGSTGAFFDTFLLLANPSPSAISVRGLFYNETGTLLLDKAYSVPANGRTTISLDAEPNLAAAGSIWTRLESQNGSTVVAERSMWWGNGSWYESHAGLGTTTAGTRFLVSAPEVNGKYTGRSYLTVANVGGGAGTVTVRLLYGDGSVGTPYDCATATFGAPTTVQASYPINLQGRLSIYVESIAGILRPNCASVPATLVGAVIDSTVPIVVEESIYSEPSPDDISILSAGGNARALRLQ